VIQLTPQMRLLVAVEPVDFRCGIDGLARVRHEALSTDPFSGALFVFRNRRATAIKILAYDGQGFWLCQNTRTRSSTQSRERRRGAASATGAGSLTIGIDGGGGVPEAGRERRGGATPDGRPAGGDPAWRHALADHPRLLWEPAQRRPRQGFSR
jgi:hypothetical protein